MSFALPRASNLIINNQFNHLLIKIYISYNTCKYLTFVKIIIIEPNYFGNRFPKSLIDITLNKKLIYSIIILE